MQCGAKRSKCADCHGVSTTAPWHRDHAFADLCAACHGGNSEANDPTEAHVGLVDPKTSCRPCHATPVSYQATAVVAPSPPSVERHGRAASNTAAGVLAVVLGAVLIGLRRRR